MSGVNPGIAPERFANRSSLLRLAPSSVATLLGLGQLAKEPCFRAKGYRHQRNRTADKGIWFRTMPLISVVIPVHGVEDYLDRCLDSVLGEPATSLEVIAVDDASPDGCGAILAARHDPRLRVISTQAPGEPGGGVPPGGSRAAVGPGPARDLGANGATGEYGWVVY